jgi:hypothetical protein
MKFVQKYEEKTFRGHFCGKKYLTFSMILFLTALIKVALPRLRFTS